MNDTDPWNPSNLIPLAELAAEGFNSEHLIHRLGDDVILDDIGRRCITRAAARTLFAERSEAQALHQARETARREDRAAHDTVPAMRARLRAIQARDTLGDPLADVKQSDFEESWERAAQTRDEIANGGMVYHSISEREQ